jgi:opine dehydrogenase
MPSKTLRFGLLGNNVSTLVMAADLKLKGFDVKLYGAPPSESLRKTLRTIKEKGGMHATGVLGDRFAPVSEVTSTVDETIRDVDVILIDPQREPLAPLVKSCLASARDGQTIVFTAGYHFALESYMSLGKAGKVTVSEMSIGPFCGMRIVESNHIDVGGEKQELRLATMPSAKTEEVVGVMQGAYPQTLPFSNVLETTLNNPNHTLHSPILLCNAARVDHTQGDFRMAVEGISPSVGRLQEAIDKERLTVAKALGMTSFTFQELMLRMYKAKGDSAYESISNVTGYSTSTRWQSGQEGILSLDIPRCYLPMSFIASALGLRTPVTDALTDLLSIAYDVDYRKQALTLDKIGLAGMKAKEILAFVRDGA